ncbi:MAG: DUF5615 family PIN-like protein [Hyphomonadaceae bacterium]|nr:DUF5615 family PIN-like protein [Hyphomonadaceae bacterium]
MKFLVGANLPPALARWLAEGGDEAVYVDHLITPPGADDAIWDLAVAQGFVIVSKDADFAARVARDQAVRVVWVRCGNLKLSLFRAWFANRADAMRRLLQMDERLIELR